jgi:hypothetical protein
MTWVTAKRAMATRAITWLNVHLWSNIRPVFNPVQLNQKGSLCR